MFSTDFIFRKQENLVDNQKCQAGFRPLCNKILFLPSYNSVSHHMKIITLPYDFDDLNTELETLQLLLIRAMVW